MALTFDDYGVSWDEVFRWGGGDAKLRYYNALVSGNIEAAGDYRAKVDHYPGLVDLPLAFLRNQLGAPDYLVGHAWTAAFGLLGIAGAMALAKVLGGRWAALLAGISLALYPRYWGHAFFNPKDIPFAAMYVWGLWALALALRDRRRDWRSALCFGALAGACMSVRVGGLLLLCYAGLFIFLQLVYARVCIGVAYFKRQAWESLRWGAVATALAFLFLLIFWPSAHQNPFVTTAGAVSAVSHFGWQGEVLFDGVSYPASEVPRRYLPAMLARTAPDFWWWLAMGCVAWLLCNAKLWRKLWSEHVAQLLVAFAVLFPLAYIMVRKSIVYDGARHVLFLIPPSAALLGCWSVNAYSALQSKYGRWAALLWATPSLGLMLWTVADMARLHPYEYIYYNRLSGGVAGAKDRFETDYWGVAFREAADILSNELPPRERPWRLTMEPPIDALVARFGKPVVPPPSLVKPFLGEHFELVSGDQQPDFYIASSRNGYHDMRDGKVLLSIARDGVVLVVVKEFSAQ